jgi:hypothetical protein
MLLLKRLLDLRIGYPKRQLVVLRLTRQPVEYSLANTSRCRGGLTSMQAINLSTRSWHPSRNVQLRQDSCFSLQASAQRSIIMSSSFFGYHLVTLCCGFDLSSLDFAVIITPPTPGTVPPSRSLPFVQSLCLLSHASYSSHLSCYELYRYPVSNSATEDIYVSFSLSPASSPFPYPHCYLTSFVTSPVSA